jgi:hypothetical protein
MSRSTFSTFWVTAGIVFALGWLESASGQSAQTPDFSGGVGGWEHARGARPIPVPGSAPAVRQDPAHPFTPGLGRTYQIGDASNPNLKPWVKEVLKKDAAAIDSGKFVGYENDSGDWVSFQPGTACTPTGVPDMFLEAGRLTFLQTPREVIIMKGSGDEIQHVYLDVPHSVNPKPSWMGESVGHYEGDTLVIDTIGENVKTVLDPFRTPHTEKLHVVQRWRTTNAGKGLEVTITADDPDTFYKPYSLRMAVERGEEPWFESICAEFNENYGLFDFHMPTAKTPDF